MPVNTGAIFLHPDNVNTKKTPLALALALLPLAVQAQETPPPSTPTGAPIPVVEIRAFDRRYLQLDQSTALGIDASVRETPLSIMVIPQDILEDQQVNNVEDALRNVAAVTKFKQGNGGEEKFSIRGFDVSQSLYKDGARLNNLFNATNIATTETANIERYEVLKGPASILFGQGEPGGVINYVTKKPAFKRKTTVELIGGQDDYKRVEFDTTGPASGNLAYRAVAAHEDSGSYRRELGRERSLFNPLLLWRAGPATTLSASYEYIRDHYTQDRGQSLAQDASGKYYYSPLMRAETFLGVPGYNARTSSKYQRAYVNLGHEFTPYYSIELLGSATDVRKSLFDSSPRVVGANNVVQISPSLQRGEGRQRYLKLNNKFDFAGPGNSMHKVLVAVSREHLDVDGQSFSANRRVNFDLLSGRYTGLDFAIDYANPFAIKADSTETTLTVQDLISWDDRYYLLLGAGNSDYEDKANGLHVRKTSPRVGFLYRPVPWLSTYASFARGFVPTTAEDAAGRPLAPETTRQAEIGAKADLLGGKLSVTGALFDVRKQDVAVTDPASLDLPPEQQYSASLGETRTRGVELQAVGQLGADWKLIGGYAYLDNEITSGDPSLGTSGNRLPGIARHSGSLWLVHDVRQGLLAGWSFGGGVFAQGKVPIGLENRSWYAGWTQVDLTASYRRGPWKLQLNLKNAFDRRYLLTQALAGESLAAVRVGTATPRTLVGSLAYQF